METELQDENESNCATALDTDGTKDSTNKNWFSKQYLLAFVLFLGTFVVRSLHVNFSIAVIEMTKNRTIEINGTMYNQPEFNWNSKVKGLILSTKIVGGFLAVIPGLFVKKLGGITTYASGLLISGILTILHPFNARFNFYVFIGSIIIEGIFEIFTYVGSFEIWSKWAIKKDRSKMVAIQFAGLYFGGAIYSPIAGYIAYNWNWPWIFYFTGGMAITTAIILLLSFSNDPFDHRHISMKEHKRFIHELEDSPPQQAIPWKAIFSSKPVWATIVQRLACACGVSFSVACLPMYINDTTHLEINNVGVLSGIPSIISIMFLPFAGYVSDYIQNKNLLNATQVHKMYVVGGNVLSAVFILLVAVQSNFILNVVLLVIYKLLLSLSHLGEQFIPLYMTPCHSGLIASIVSYGSHAGNIITPMVAGFIVTSEDSFQWSIFLSLLSTILLTGGIVFLLFGSSEPQPWSRPPDDDVRDQETERVLK